MNKRIDINIGSAIGLIKLEVFNELNSKIPLSLDRIATNFMWRYNRDNLVVRITQL